MTPLAAGLLAWYERSGRKHLPWRVVRDPYRTLVSEFMLQQTQVDRVVPKFETFIAALPDILALAEATVADVLRLWQGLGYNSRAVRLKRVAEAVVRDRGGVIPADRDALLSLHGIGPYTAAAIRAFGYNIDDAPLDTNIRRIVHRLHFGIEVGSTVKQSELDAAARAMAPAGVAHDWNSALMDLGAGVCTARAPRCMICPVRAHCAAQPVDPSLLERARRSVPEKRSPQERIPFEQTTRFARGRIVDRLRALPSGHGLSLLQLHGDLNQFRPIDELERLVRALEREGLVVCTAGSYKLHE